MRGYTHFKFASIKGDDGNYSPWVRVDLLPDAKILSHAFMTGTDAKARHSSTDVEIDLPDGTIIKTVEIIWNSMVRNKTSTAFIEIIRDGKLTFDGIKFVEEKRQDDYWATVIELDGKRVIIPE